MVTEQTFKIGLAPAASDRETAYVPLSYPTQHQRIPSLDGIRGFAALWIFFYHYLPGNNSSARVVHWISQINRFGWSAVSLFFVLSGFLITGILWNSFPRDRWWRRFSIRRASRIFPLYYLALGICVVIYRLEPTHDTSMRQLVVHAFYLQDIPSLQHLGGALPQSIFLLHFWSLAVEEQFYLVWPFVLAALFKRTALALPAIAGFWTLSLALRTANFFYAAHHVGTSTLWSSASLIGRSGELLAGAFLALIVRREARGLELLYRYLPRILGASFLASIAVLATSSAAGPDDPVTGTIGLSVISIFYASLIAITLRPGIIRSFFETPLLRWCGTISYGIYVYHMLFLPQFEAIRDRLVPDMEQKELRAALLMLIAVIATAILATISFRFVESPILRLTKTFTQEKAIASTT